MRSAALGVSGFSGVGCQSTVKQQSTAVDTSLGQTHPLTGKIFSVADQAFVTEAQLLDALSGADYVLLGEKHDNPIHHQIQAKIVAGLPNLGAVQLEMLTMNKAQRLSSATSEKEFRASNWQSSVGGVFNLSDLIKSIWSEIRPLPAHTSDDGLCYESIASITQ